MAIYGLQAPGLYPRCFTRSPLRQGTGRRPGASDQRVVLGSCRGLSKWARGPKGPRDASSWGAGAASKARSTSNLVAMPPKNHTKGYEAKPKLAVGESTRSAMKNKRFQLSWDDLRAFPPQDSLLAHTFPIIQWYSLDSNNHKVQPRLHWTGNNQNGHQRAEHVPAMVKGASFTRPGPTATSKRNEGTRSKDATRSKGIATRGSWHRYWEHSYY